MRAGRLRHTTGNGRLYAIGWAKKGKKQMNALKGICWLIILGVVAVPATAGVVDMQFTGLPGNNSYSGVASYPYNISVNGGSNLWMMCIGYNDHIEGGETWQAHVASVGSLDLLTHAIDYKPLSCSRWRLPITVLIPT